MAWFMILGSKMKVVELVVQSDRDCGILWWRGRGEELAWTHVYRSLVFCFWVLRLEVGARAICKIFYVGAIT